MISQYIRMFLFFISIGIAYIALLYFFPVIGKTIDEKIGITWNTSINDFLSQWEERIKEKKESMDKKLENPVPNISRGIEGRMGQ